MRLRGLRKKICLMVLSRPGLERKALHFFRSIEETRHLLEKNKKIVKKIKNKACIFEMTAL